MHQQKYDSTQICQSSQLSGLRGSSLDKVGVEKSVSVVFAFAELNSAL